MQLINTNELKPHPQNDYYFDDIQGDNWDEFLKSIKTSGVIEPIVITQDKMIVSGHQRVKACKELGVQEIPCKVHIYEDEDKVLKDLIETNIRQRGMGNPNPVKFGRCLVELERIYGITNGGNRGNQYNKKEAHWNNSNLPTQKDLADQIGIDQSQLINYKKLTTLIPELQDLIETDQIKATAGYKIWAKMSPEEQEKFFNEIGADRLKEMTIKETQEYIQKTKRLEQALEKEKNKPPQIIDNTDYSTINKLKRQVEINQRSYNALEQEKQRLEKQIKLNEEDAKKYQELKKQIEYLKSEKQDLHRQIESATSISRLVVDIEHLLQNKLAPIKYSRAVFEQLHDDVVINNLTEVVNRVRQWCDEIAALIPNQIIEMEDTYYESR